MVQAQHLLDRPARGFAARPPGHGLGNRIQKLNQTVGVGNGNPVAERVQRGREPPLLVPQLGFNVVLVQRQFNGTMQLLRLEGLEQVPVRHGFFGACQSAVIGRSRQVYDRTSNILADLFGRVDAVDAAVQTNVHQHQIGPQSRRLLDCRFAGDGAADHAVAQSLQRFLEIEGHDPLVLDDQDSSQRNLRGFQIRCVTIVVLQHLGYP